MAKEIKDTLNLLSLVAVTASLIGLHSWMYVQ